MKERACYSTTTHKGTRPASSNLQGTGALLEDPGPVVSLRFSSPQPLDPVAEQLTLLVVHELVAVAGFGFAQDRAPRLDADGPAEYPVSDHREAPLWSGPPEGGGALAGVTSYLTTPYAWWRPTPSGPGPSGFPGTLLVGNPVNRGNRAAPPLMQSATNS